MPGKKKSEPARREEILDSALQTAVEWGLDGLTIRRIAANAHLSSGLVLFHFKTRHQLLLALLDWLLAQTLEIPSSSLQSRTRSPGLPRLSGMLRREMLRLSREPAHIRLLFEFWVQGVRDPEIGQRMRRELARYRGVFGPVGDAVLRLDPRRFSGVSPDGIATVAVSFIKGCAVQAMLDPEGFDIEQHLRAVDRLVAPLRSSIRPAEDPERPPRGARGGFDRSSPPKRGNPEKLGRRRR